MRSKYVQAGLILLLLALPARAQLSGTEQPEPTRQAGHRQAEQQPPAPAQQPAEPTQQDPQRPPGAPVSGNPVERHVLRSIWNDQVTIWTSPFHPGHDKRWILPVAGLTVGLIASDKWSSRHLSSARALSVGRDISNVGSDGINYGIAGSTYLVSKFLHNRRGQEAGFLGLESALYSSEVVRVLKIATNRKRPKDGGDAHFWNGGKGFPSGHAAHSWAIATVFAHQYSNRPLIKWGAYGWATAVSVSRLTGRNHYASDIVVGSTIGYLIGRYVVNHHGRKPRTP